MKKVIIWAIASFILLTCVSLSLAENNFVTHKDPHGFSIVHPQGWQVKLLGSGCIVVSEDADNLVGPTAVIWTMSLKSPTSSKEVLGSLVNFIKLTNPTFNVISTRVLDTKTNDAVLKASYTEPLTGSDYKMFLVCSVDNKNAMVSGFFAPIDRYSIEKINLVGILNSFKIEPGLRDQKKIAPPSGDFVLYRDPNEGAFTLLVPKGWQVRGGLIRPYIDAAVALEIKKDVDAKTAIYFEQPATPIFTEPNQVLAMAGFVEGSRYNASYGTAQDSIVMRYLGGVGYLENYFLPRTKAKYPDLEVLELKDRQDLVRFIPKDPMTANIDAAEAQIKFNIDGIPVRCKISIVTQRVVTPGMSSGLWYATYLAYNAVSEEFEQTESIVSVIRDSFKIDPNWKNREAQEVIKRSAILSKSATDVANIISSTYENRAHTMDEISRKWSNQMLGVVDLVDSQTGEIHYGVPNGSNYYWTNGSKFIGTVAGTNTAESPGAGFREMQNYDDLIKD